MSSTYRKKSTNMKVHTPFMKQRNGHWRVQSFVGNPQAIKSDTAPVSPFPGKFDENNISINPNMLGNSTPNPVESDPSRDVASKIVDRQPEIVNKGIPLPMPLPNITPPVRSHGVLGHPLQGQISDAQSTQCPTTSASNALSQHEELTVEGGTISISSVYSQGLQVLICRRLVSQCRIILGIVRTEGCPLEHLLLRIMRIPIQAIRRWRILGTLAVERTPIKLISASRHKTSVESPYSPPSPIFLLLYSALGCLSVHLLVSVQAVLWFFPLHISLNTCWEQFPSVTDFFEEGAHVRRCRHPYFSFIVHSCFECNNWSHSGAISW